MNNTLGDSLYKSRCMEYMRFLPCLYSGASDESYIGGLSQEFNSLYKSRCVVYTRFYLVSIAVVVVKKKKPHLVTRSTGPGAWST